MGKLEQFAIASAPMPAVARILSHFDRRQVRAFIEVAIGLLDTFDGPDDPETLDFSRCSDGQPGELADHEPCGDEEPGAYAEWTSLRASQRRSGFIQVNARGTEDDELGGDEADGDGAEDEECAWFTGKAAPGCPLADPGGSQAYDN